MANQPETSSWSTGVYQWEVTDPAQGGIGGVMNTPILQLASRTRWLKDQVDTLAASISGGAPLNSPNFIGNPTAPTASQFDNDTSIATTAFVQRALGNLGGVDSYNASFTLVASQAGRGVLYYGGTDASAVLPLSSACPTGSAFLVHNVSGFTLTVQRQGGDVLLGVGGATSVALGPGDSLLVANQNAAGQWMVLGGSAQSRYSYSATLKANTSGSYPGMSVGHAAGAGNSDTLDGWDLNDVRQWGNLLNVPALVYDNGGTYGINIGGNAATASTAGNADTVDGYHAGGFWRTDQAASGYNWYKLPNGLIFQFGKASQPQGTRPITFPIAFPNVILHVGGMKSDPDSSWGPQNGIAINKPTLNGAEIGSSESGQDVLWIAIGY